MQVEVVKNNKSQIKEALIACLIQPTVMTSASAVNSLAKYGGVKNAIQAQNHSAFRNLNLVAKNNGVDIFTRSQTIAKAYDDGYAPLAKSVAKANKKLQKLLDKKDISLKDKIINLFIRDPNKKITFYSKKYALETQCHVASTNLEKAKNALRESVGNFDSEKLDTALGLCEKKIKKCGSELTEEVVQGKGIFQNADAFSKKIAQEVAEVGTKATIIRTIRGFSNAVKSNFRRELSPKFGFFNYVMTGFQFLPSFKNDVLPAFKNKGFLNGIKETGITMLRIVADLVGYASGGAIGRAVGAVVGGTICPGVGHKIGAMAGDMFATMLVGTMVVKTVDKALGIQSEEVQEEMGNFLYERACSR